jgi:hypothetical protein
MINQIGSAVQTTLHNFFLTQNCYPVCFHTPKI